MGADVLALGSVGAQPPSTVRGFSSGSDSIARSALFVDADTDLSVDGGFEVWLARRDADDEPVLVDEAIGVGRHQVRVGE